MSNHVPRNQFALTDSEAVGNHVDALGRVLQHDYPQGNPRWWWESLISAAVCEVRHGPYTAAQITRRIRPCVSCQEAVTEQFDKRDRLLVRAASPNQEAQ